MSDAESTPGDRPRRGRRAERVIQTAGVGGPHLGDGHDTIVDFTPTGANSDRVWLAGTDLHSFADVVAHASFNSATGATTITHNDTDAIVLNGVTPNQLTADQFIFS